MAPTLQNHDGSGWFWLPEQIVSDLAAHGASGVVITRGDVSCGVYRGNFGDCHFTMLWRKDQHLLLTLSVFNQLLIDAFSAVLENPPECTYCESESCPVYVIWNKVGPAMKVSTTNFGFGFTS